MISHVHSTAYLTEQFIPSMVSV